ncbi:hypothetical protein PQO01_08295 [Lentisphaera marina]|uniref:hypothetical protein n=1 Tax=Lentisphaera marina TaxID=1111041 RepID=UPI002365E2B2|nr:hypothetical protein [Lentisphaera marina]MDD7984943.1 hypothetical protein [Lentisphaera marina]
MKLFIKFTSLLCSAFLASCSSTVERSPVEGRIHLTDQMPNFPEPYDMRDWNQVASDFDKVLYDLNAKGTHLPLTHLISPKDNINTGKAGFGFTSYVGPTDEHKDSFEAIAVMGSVLGATYNGQDKSNGKYNWVEMCEQYYNSANGRNLVLNHIDTDYDSFWYTVFPHILFYSIYDRYPETGKMKEIVRITADKWYDAAVILNKKGFDFTYFDFDKNKAKKNGKWTEPDSAAGIGWLMYAAWLKLKDPKYLEAAKWCFDYLDSLEIDKNPYYEVQLPFGAYAAVRMNAELGTNYDTTKFVNWCFDHTSLVRGDMGVIHKRWEGNDCHGLVGSINTPPWRHVEGGYAFAMNTFAMAAPFISMVRYDERYSRDIGKWILNAANASRLFYSDYHPAKKQSSPEWREESQNVIAYEGLRQFWNENEPALYASGDATKYNWGYDTDFGLYGSSYVGVFGGAIRTTNHKYILQLDCLATEFDRANSYPSYLYFNPYNVVKKVDLELPPGKFDIYNTLNNSFMAKAVSAKTQIAIPANGSVVIVLAPANGKITKQLNKTLINGVVVDYR